MRSMLEKPRKVQKQERPDMQEKVQREVERPSVLSSTRKARVESEGFFDTVNYNRLADVSARRGDEQTIW